MDRSNKCMQTFIPISIRRGNKTLSHAALHVYNRINIVVKGQLRVLGEARPSVPLCSRLAKTNTQRDSNTLAQNSLVSSKLQRDYCCSGSTLSRQCCLFCGLWHRWVVWHTSFYCHSGVLPQISTVTTNKMEYRYFISLFLASLFRILCHTSSYFIFQYLLRQHRLCCTERWEQKVPWHNQMRTALKIVHSGRKVFFSLSK